MHRTGFNQRKISDERTKLCDVLNAVSALKNYPLADPDRIGMWGHSMGGFLTLRTMVVSPDIKAGVIWAGVVASYPDLLTRWRRRSGPTPTPNPLSSRRWRYSWTGIYGTPEENPEFWYGMSSNNYLSDISGPVQLHHGEADTDVPLEFSELLSAEMQAAGKTVELYTYPGDNHNISVRKSKLCLCRGCQLTLINAELDEVILRELCSGRIGQLPNGTHYQS